MEPRNLRLYVLRGTPNSTRAEQNLELALAEIGGPAATIKPEIIDVVTSSRLALNDGVIVTPTLIGRRGEWCQTILGDLSDMKRLQLFLLCLTSV
jgi:hypothetical protein